MTNNGNITGKVNKDDHLNNLSASGSLSASASSFPVMIARAGNKGRIYLEIL